jgi:predicted secreted protein
MVPTIGCGSASEYDETTAADAEDALSALVIDSNDNGKTFVVPQGQSVRVELPSNRTTGYRWMVGSTDKTFGYPATDTYTTTSQGVGGGGVQKLTWKTKAPIPVVGTHKVVLEYRRPWDENVKPAKTFTFHVTITGSTITCANVKCASGTHCEMKGINGGAVPACIKN